MSFLGFEINTLNLIGLLLFMGAMGKSAQFLLHTWLPDAMEGPTPVSALIHAATMVTAGVFLVARMSPLYEFAPLALNVIVIVGATTAFFAATVGLVQNDIKRVIAYSTCSQLGYMFVALGLGAYSVAIFHLFTHAFFKALLFLGAGSVIHAVSHEQDMRHMGGLYRHIPFTYAMMLIGTIALTGVGLPGTYFGTAGFFSKDAIIEATYASQNIFSSYAFGLIVIAAFMTSFYSWRLVFMTFHGKPRASRDVMSHVHESPLVMTLPLLILSVGALFAGVLFLHEFAYADGVEHFFKGSLFFAEGNTLLVDLHNVPFWVKASPFVMMLAGLALAYAFYIARPSWPARFAAQHEVLYQFLLNKWYFDELYNVVFVRPSLAIGRIFWKRGDKQIIDGLGPDGVASRVVDITRGVGILQTGYVYHYAFVMLIGVAALLTWFMFAGA
jgi:NADH-quinone oxidoreductase subunit L